MSLIRGILRGILTGLAAMSVFGFIGIIQLGFNSAKADSAPDDYQEEQVSDYYGYDADVEKTDMTD